MRFTVNIPMLLSSRTNSGTGKFELIRDMREVEFEQIDPDDAPVAVSFGAKGKPNNQILRHFDGSFYRKAGAAVSEIVQEEAIAEAARIHGDCIISDRRTRNEIRIGRINATTRFWHLWNASARSMLGINIEHRRDLSFSILHSLENETSRMRTVAAEAVTEGQEVAIAFGRTGVVIGQELWIKTPEPIFILNMHGAGKATDQIGGKWTIDMIDFSVFRNKAGPSHNLPKPWGLNRNRRTLSSYWLENFSFIPFMEAMSSKEYRIFSNASINIPDMPDAFSSDISELALERMARVSVLVCGELADDSDAIAMHMAEELTKFESADDMMKEMMKCRKALVQFLKAAPNELNIDAIAECLIRLKKTLKHDDDYSGNETQNGTKIRLLRMGIADALRRWEDRPVSMTQETVIKSVSAPTI